MKPKKEYVVLAALIIALISYLMLRKTDRQHYQLPDPPQVAGARISKIELNLSGKNLVLTQTDDAWRIGPNAYLADSDKIRNMVDVIGQLSITALVSESGNYVRYGLENDSRISVKAWAKDDLIRDFEIGKNAPTFQHTFVKLAGDPNVYHASGDFRGGFDQTLDNLRDKSVLAFKPDSITQLTATTDKTTLTAELRPVSPDNAGETETAPETAPTQEKEQPGEFLWQDDQGSPLEKANIQRLLAPLSRLKCGTYIYDKEKTDFKDPVIAVVLKGDRDYSLEIFPKTDPGDGNHPAISSDNPHPFELPESMVTTISSAIEALITQ